MCWPSPFVKRVVLFGLPWLLAAGAGLPAAAQAQPRPPETAARSAVTVTDLAWVDPARDRVLPLRLRVPGGQGPFPVILFSHGLGGSVAAGTAWGEYWAGNGYIVLHLQHPGSDDAVWKGAADPKRSLLAAASARQLLARVQDVRFALDELARKQRAGDPLLKSADLTRIGMSGHSFGAQTTQAVAGQRFAGAASGIRGGLADSRISAALAFSPAAPVRPGDNGQGFSGIILPFMSITGTHDGDVIGTGVTPQRRQQPFREMPPPDKYLLVLNGADHMVFNGQPGVRTTVAAEAAVYPWVKRLSLAFWNAHLKGDAAARDWLQSEAPALELGSAGLYAFK
jgi:predicted dienelactone hydrolase